MKTYSLFTCAFAALELAALAQAPVGPGAVKLGKVQPEVVKTPEFSLSSGPTKRSKLGQWLDVELEYETKPEEIDELTFKFTILIEKKLLDGEVTYVNIPKERNHYAVMYVAPRSLEKLTGGRPLTPASIENVWVTVTHQGQELDKPAAFKPSQVPNLPHLPGMVLNKDETPFAPLYYDRYEAIKKTR
ncbi:MAG TPA: Amuc_1102 family pilus-like protein [Chthoniobacteraceae bacterium]|nr:Amuc_1102 family pilus-like protein [Chthoniobacteraceae bacterium]